MGDGTTGAGPQLGRRWTLRGIMIVIAAIALPLAVAVRHIREVERMRREAEAARDQATADYRRASKAVDDILRAASEAPTPPLPPAASGTR